jgi:hypothetical protein
MAPPMEISLPPVPEDEFCLYADVSIYLSPSD